jgi:PAS domain S-box-containing protein
MKFRWPISKNIIITALIFGAVILTVAEMGFKIPVIGPAKTDPRELFVTLGAALTGPIGGIIIGLMSISWSGEISASNIATLAAHVLGAFFIAITYKNLVYRRMKLPWLFFGWAGLVVIFYYLILIPVYILVFFWRDPTTFELAFGDINVWNVYILLGELAFPEMIFTVVVTVIIIAALPPKYRCPLWCHYDGSTLTVKNNTLAVRLTVWFLLLSSLPLTVVAVYVLNSVESGFDQLTIDHQKEQAQLLAVLLSNSTEPQAVSLVQEKYCTKKHDLYIINLNGKYLFHRNHSKIGTLISEDFAIESVKLLLSGKTNAFIDSHKNRVVGYAGIKDQKKIVVTTSDNDFANGLVSMIRSSSRNKISTSFFIISITCGLAVWLIIGRPVRQLTRFAQQVGKGNLDIELDPGDAVDELQVLSFTFNEMADRLKYLIEGLREKVMELEKTEKRLIYSEDQYRSLNDNIPVGVFRTTPEGNFLSANTALFQMMAVEDKTTIDTITSDKFYKNIEDRAVLLTEVQSKKLVSGFECQMKRDDGTSLWASISVCRVEGDDGQIKYLDGVIEDISERKKFLQEQKASEARLRALSVKLQEVEEAGRKEIARELHDRVGQSLTALNINLNILHNQLRPEQMEKVNTRLMDSIELVEETTVSIRDVMAELRPQVLDDYGLAASLRWYSERFSKRTVIKVALETATIDETRFSEEIETALFRISQEAFTNITKYARATNVLVTAVKAAESISLTIVDDGRGFNVEDDRSLQYVQNWGLTNMRERAETLGGQFQIESGLGKGTRLKVEIPVPGQPPNGEKR